MNFDIIVIGSGMAGLPCAIKAAERKKSVLLVNKNKEIGGKLFQSTGQIAAAGSNLQKRKKILDDSDLHLKEAWNICKASAELKLLRLAIDNAAGTVNWLEDIGVTFPENHPVITYQHDIYSTRRYQWPKGNGIEILEKFKFLIEKYIASNNITLLNETLFSNFIFDESNEIIGVKLLNKKNDILKMKSRKIVLTSGGYTNNEEMFKKFSPTASLYTPKFKGSYGLVHEIALKNNIKIDGGNLYLGMLGGVLKDPNDKHSVKIAINTIPQDRPPWEIWVNSSGNRFMREDHPSADYRRKKVNEQKKQKFFIIFDNNILINAPPISSTKDGGLMSHIDSDFKMHKFKSIDDLSYQMIIDRSNLCHTINTFNKAVDAKTDVFGREHMPRKIQNPPFHCIESVAFALPSPAGIAIDERFRVLNNNNVPIKNIFAAGEIIGNTRLMGNHYIAGMGVGPTITFGKLIGESI